MPVNKTVHLLVTGADVIHSFTIPSFGVRIDAVPGRVNESWFRADKIGNLLRPVLQTLRQGSRLHADRLQGRERAEDYQAWLITAKKNFASIDSSQKPVRFAGAQ